MKKLLLVSLLLASLGFAEETANLKKTVGLSEEQKETKKEIDESSIKETLFVLVEQQASKYDFSNDYENLANISREIDSNKEEIANLETYRKELSKWLNIKESLGNLKAFKTAKFFLGTVAKKNFEPLKDKLRNFEHTYIEEISDESSQINIMLLTSNTEEKELKNELKTYSFTETNFNFDTSFTEEYEKTKSREEELKKANEKLKEKVEKLLKLIPKLLIQKEYLDNALMRETVVSNFKATDTVNVIEGYIPLDMEEEFKKIVNKNSNKSNYLEITEVDKDDEEVPILLKNSGITGLFASITQMYALPRYNEIDPTAILSIFYWIFFGMMVADFAYGLILFILSGLALMIGKFDENKRKYENLLNKIDSLIEENEILKEKVKVFDLSKKENDDYFTRRKVGAFDNDLQSNSLLITKIWDFNKNILKEWADVKLLLDINDRAKTQKMKKGLKSIAKDFKKIVEYLEDICFDSSEIKEDEVIIMDEKNGKKE